MSDPHAHETQHLAARTLGKLATELGERSTYDAASQCSRCGYCEQACPTYVATGNESRSPRGRNQIVRLMLEGKVAGGADAWEALSTCLLCGACSSACYAHIPTPDLVLEGRRRLSPEASPAGRWLGRLMARRPKAVGALLKAAYAIKRSGLARLAGALGVSRLFGLGALAEAERHIEDAPRRFLAEELRERPCPPDPRWHYVAACGPNFVLPRIGRATIRVLEAKAGPVRFMDNGCCGLLAYNYGRLEDAVALARGLIRRDEAVRAAAGSQAPVVVDCSSCAAFLKSYPQLFLDDPAWRGRAEAFASRVRDVVEVLGTLDLPSAPPGGIVTVHDSCRACHGQGLRAQPRAAARAVAGKDFVELPESDVCCGGAGLFAFAHPELSDDVLRRKIGAAASVHARWIVTSSTSCLIQLAVGLKKYYPDAAALHVSELAASALFGKGEPAPPGDGKRRPSEDAPTPGSAARDSCHGTQTGA